MAVPDVVIGGVLAALSGLAVTRYGVFVRREQSTRQWFQRSDHLLSRLSIDDIDFDEPSTHEQNAYANTAHDVVELLETHFSQAPNAPPETATEQFTTLREAVAYMNTRTTNNDAYAAAARDVSAAAEDLKTEIDAMEFRLPTRIGRVLRRMHW